MEGVASTSPSFTRLWPRHDRTIQSCGPLPLIPSKVPFSLVDSSCSSCLPSYCIYQGHASFIFVISIKDGRVRDMSHERNRINAMLEDGSYVKIKPTWGFLSPFSLFGSVLAKVAYAGSRILVGNTNSLSLICSRM